MSSMTRPLTLTTMGACAVAALVAFSLITSPSLDALGQAPAGAAMPGARGGAPAPDPTKPHRLEVTKGTKARYKVQEQLAGINFPSQAVGTTEAVTGFIVVNPAGTFGAGSKLTVDLKTLTSDQSMRDGYIQGRTLETEKFPTLELVPKRTDGLASPMPATGQAGFRLVTDMTMHGVTKEVVWTVVSTFANDNIAGRATTIVDFTTFNLTKPSLARLMSVDDKIELEVEFRFSRAVVP